MVGGIHKAEWTVNDIRRVGIDLAKKVFHVTAVNRGGVVERKRLRRAGLALPVPHKSTLDFIS